MKKAMRILLWATFGIYCFALFVLLFLDGRVPSDGSVGFYFAQSNLIPFRSVYDYVQRLMEDRINIEIVIRNITGNLILLLPMGCFLPCLSKPFRRYWRTLAVCFGVICMVELLQPLLRIGFFDIDDLIFNLAGASLGFLIVQIPFVNHILKKLYLYTE